MKAGTVKFHSIEVIELAVALGDNPSVSCGAPLTTEWCARRRTTFDVDFFEEYRPPRRTLRELILSESEREEILIRQGYTRKQIKAACEEVANVRGGKQSPQNVMRTDETKAIRRGIKFPFPSLFQAKSKVSPSKCVKRGVQAMTNRE